MSALNDDIWEGYAIVVHGKAGMSAYCTVVACVLMGGGGIAMTAVFLRKWVYKRTRPGVEKS